MDNRVIRTYWDNKHKFFWNKYYEVLTTDDINMLADIHTRIEFGITQEQLDSIGN